MSVLRSQVLGFEFWVLDFGCPVLGLGSWVSGFWVSGFGSQGLWSPGLGSPGLGSLGLGSCFLSFWVLGLRSLVSGIGSLVSGIGCSVLGLGSQASRTRSPVLVVGTRFLAEMFSI